MKKLPSKGTTPYSGKYPTRIRSFGGRGVYHLELNNGDRYVVTRADMADRQSFNGTVGTELADFVREEAITSCDLIPLAEYAAIVLLQRLVFCLRCNQAAERAGRLIMQLDLVRGTRSLVEKTHGKG